MEIKKQWIVDGYKHLVLLKSGVYMIGFTSNQYGYQKISQSEALELIING
jgi:hypothetical protein